MYRMAFRHVEEHRRIAEDIALRNREVLRAAAPEYEPLRLELLNTQIEQARCAVLGEAQDAVRARTEVLAARLDAVIRAAGFDEQQLRPQYHCGICSDTGRDNGTRCACVEREMRRLRREQINREFPLDLCDFAHFSLERYSAEVDPELGTSTRAVMTQVLEYCQAYAAHFRSGCTSLLLMGDAGLGKTHLALAMANRVLDAGYDVVYVSAQQAFSAMDDHSAREEGEAWLEAMLGADLLILDDLGTEYVTPHTISILYQIVNTRLCSRRPTIYTTNIVTQQLMNARYTEKVASRLLGGCELLQFFGEDVRLQDKF